MKYLRRGVARDCPVHNAIMEKCVERLTASGAFEKDEVLEASNFAAVGGAVRWDYVREFIEQDYSCELVPLVSRFFHSTRQTREKGWTPQSNPEKYIAAGNGKKTAGYAAVGLDRDLDAVFIRVLERKRNAKDGVAAAFDKYMAEVKKRKLALPAERELKALGS